MEVGAQCSCGATLGFDQRFCGACGNGVPVPVSQFCSSCGQQLILGQPFCSGCGTRSGAPMRLAQMPLASAGQFVTRATFPSYSVLDACYVSEFDQMAQTGEIYKGKWNWAAFFFGAFWALTKGLWLPALIAIVGSIFTGGVVGVVYWFIFGVRGNYMYYSKVVNRKDLPI